MTSYYYDIEDLETIPCPDGIPGCCVLHTKSKKGAKRKVCKPLTQSAINTTTADNKLIFVDATGMLDFRD